MQPLYLLITIVNRCRLTRFLKLYQKNHISVSFVTLGVGTANSETLDMLGLESADKAVGLCVVTDEVWLALKHGLQHELHIDVPGTGVAFTVPLSSVGGSRALQFLTDGIPYEKGAETALKDTKYELLVVIANHGCTDLVMDAAREAGATGGTAIHARGTGMERAEQFFGVSLAAEKELLFLVTPTPKKNAIMRSIMEKAGMETRAKAIVFSLPVTDTAGLRLIEG